METRTVAHEGLCVELSEKLWGDERRRKTFGAKLAQAFNPDKSEDAYYVWLESDLTELIAALSQVRSHSGFDLPSVMDTPEDMMQKVSALDELPDAFMKEWIETAALLRGPKGDPDLAPPDQISDAKKKTPRSKPNE